MNLLLRKHADYLNWYVVFCGCRSWVNVRERKRGSMCTLCHEGQWIATKRLYYCCSLIKSPCKHRRCQFIHTVARETSPKRLELSGYQGDPPPHTVRKLLLSTCVGLEGLIPLQHFNFILIQTCLKGGGGQERRIPEVSPWASSTHGGVKTDRKKEKVPNTDICCRCTFGLSWCTAGCFAENLSFWIFSAILDCVKFLGSNTYLSHNCLKYILREKEFSQYRPFCTFALSLSMFNFQVQATSCNSCHKQRLSMFDLLIWRGQYYGCHAWGDLLIRLVWGK